MAICQESAVPWFFTCVVFISSAVLVVHVPFLFSVWGRVWNLIVSVPDHCLFIYFTSPSCGPNNLYVYEPQQDPG